MLQMRSCIHITLHCCHRATTNIAKETSWARYMERLRNQLWSHLGCFWFIIYPSSSTKGTYINDVRRFLTPPPPNVRFLPCNVQFFGDILDPPPPPLKSDIIYARSLTSKIGKYFFCSTPLSWPLWIFTSKDKGIHTWFICSVLLQQSPWSKQSQRKQCVSFLVSLVVLYLPKPGQKKKLNEKLR